MDVNLIQWLMKNKWSVSDVFVIVRTHTKTHTKTRSNEHSQDDEFLFPTCIESIIKWHRPVHLLPFDVFLYEFHRPKLFTSISIISLVWRWCIDVSLDSSLRQRISTLLFIFIHSNPNDCILFVRYSVGCINYRHQNKNMLQSTWLVYVT